MADSHSKKLAKNVVETARRAFQTGKTKSLKFREQQLRNLLRLFEENTLTIVDVLAQDLHKSKQEVVILELEMLIYDLKYILDNLSAWSEPEHVSKAFPNWLDKVCIKKEPYGVVLVIGAWNYPFLLSLGPFIGAVAAGNTVILKPSEISGSSANFMFDTIPKYLDHDCYQVYCGGPEETTELLQHKFDYIFFTGSPQVGKIIHAAATKHLTPTTLELGGKSPVYIDNSADMEITVKRLLWGKWINAGQTCIAPDYVLCTKEVESKLLVIAKRVLKEWYHYDLPEISPDFCRIINDKNFKRLSNYLTSGNIAIGGKSEAKDRLMQLTILTDVNWTHPVMNEEIFGPILPILNVENAYEAVSFINGKGQPLALYIFSNNKKDINFILDNTSSGGVCVNDVVMHFAAANLPFGGIGNSGMGSYHGKQSFDTFTHRRSCLYKNASAIGEILCSGRYPPYSENKITILQCLLKYHKGMKLTYLPHVIMFALGVLASYGFRYINKLLNEHSN